MLKIRRPLGRLIFNMGIAIPGKTVFLIETAPWLPGWIETSSQNNKYCYHHQETKWFRDQCICIAEDWIHLWLPCASWGVGPMNNVTSHEHKCISRYWQLACLFNYLFRLATKKTPKVPTKKTPKLCIPGTFWWESPVTGGLLHKCQVTVTIQFIPTDCLDQFDCTLQTEIFIMKFKCL